MNVPAEYQERFCAFVDLLGFKTILREHNPIIIRELLSTVHSPFVGPTNAQAQSGFIAQSISDAVVVSTTLNYVGLRHMLFSLSELAVHLFMRGFYVRGAIAQGQLFQDAKMAFGPALVEAYELESTVAKVPRIVVSQKIIRTIHTFDERSWF